MNLVHGFLKCSCSEALILHAHLHLTVLYIIIGNNQYELDFLEHESVQNFSQEVPWQCVKIQVHRHK